MNIRNLRKRKAISPVLATVILIAITLIAAIAIAGFVFGLFGSFTSTARIQVTSVSFLVANTKTQAGNTITAANTGTANGAINSVSLTYGGVTCTLSGLSTTVTAGGTQTLTLTTFGLSVCAVPVAGEAFTGNLGISNGGQVPFTGTYQ